MDRNSSKRQQSELTDDEVNSKRTKQNGNSNNNDLPEQNRLFSDSDPQSMETDQTIGINMAEVLLVVNIDTSKDGRKDGVSNAIRASLALKNSCGGLIRLNDESSTKNMDKWITKYSQQERDHLNNLGEHDPHCDGLHLKYSDNDFIFVRKSSNILTDKPNLLIRREKGVDKIKSFQVKSMLTTCRNNQCQCRTCEKSLQEWECFTKDSILPEQLSESKFIEFKNFPDDKFSPNSVKAKVKENVVAFGNTDGGTLYIGIEDDRKVVGQVIADEDKPQIESFLQKFIKETIWIPYSKNSKVTPVKDVNYHIHFFPVEGVVEGDPKRKVIAVEICAFKGTVFLDEPKCPTIDDKNQIVDMALKDWLEYFQNADQDEESSKYGRMVYGRTVYKPLKGTMDNILHSLEDSKQVQLHPKHAKQWINNDTLNLLLGGVTETLTSGGHVFVQKSWNALLCTRIKLPTSIICDVLLCSPQSPLVLVTLVDEQEICNIEVSYNIALATTLKRVLVEEAGCLEEFLVKPVVITKENLESIRAENIFLEPDCYPTSYVSMSPEKYSKILEALAVVLTRVNSSISYEAGQNHFMVLTEEQYESLDYCYGSASHVKITGLPGTGKTLLALERITRLRMEQQLQLNEVLYVCSNKTLAAKVKNQKLLNDEPPLCKVMNYWQLIESLKFPNQGEISKVKHIVADEVHSYKQQPRGVGFKWWERLIDLVINKHLTLWMFLDDSQRITKEPTVTIPDGIVSRRLKTVIRTTGNVFNFFTRYIKSDVQDVVLGHDIQGSMPTILIPVIQTCKNLLNILLDNLYRLIVVQGHSANSITVLFADTKEREHYQKLFVSRTIDCPIRSGEEVRKQGVIFDTVRCYSGDDNGIVVGFCPKFYKSPRFQDNYALMASLCSRPRLELILVFDSVETATFFGVQRHEWKLCPPSKSKKYDFSSRNVFPR